MTIRVSFLAELPIQTRRWARNTRGPSAELQNALASLANYAAYVRAKPVFQFSTNLADIPDTSMSDRDRWRFAFHTSPFCEFVRVEMLLARRNALTPIKALGKMVVRDSTGAIVGTAQVQYGGGGLGSPSDVPSEFGGGTATVMDAADELVPLTFEPDADYFCTFVDFQYARLVSATVWEVSKLPSVAAGYVPNTQGAGSPIYDADRAMVAENARLLHRRFAPQLWNWTVDNGGQALAGSETNLVDNSSTTVTTTTPGVTLDLSRRVTLRTTSQGVPVVMWAYLSAVSEAPDATIKLKNSGGTALLTITATDLTTGWYRTTGYLPASSGKYDLHGAATAGSVNVHAVSIYELDYTPQTMTVTFTTVSSVRQLEAASIPGIDWTATVTVYDGTQSNVVVTFTMPRDNEPTSDGARGVITPGLGGRIDDYNPGWTVATSTTSTEFIITFSRATLAAGSHTLTMAALVDAVQCHALIWGAEGSFDVDAAGSSNEVEAATGDTATISVGNVTVTTAWAADPTTTGTPTQFTLTIAPTTVNTSSHTLVVSLDTGATTSQPTTISNPDGWTIGSWAAVGGDQWQATLTKSGSITAGNTNTITFSTTPSTTGDLTLSALLTAANDFGASGSDIVTVNSGSSSLAHMAALLGAGPR